MPKLKLLILDAGVVIYLHEIGLWQQVVANCDLYLSRIVAETEVLFQKSEQDEYGYDIDLSPMIKSGAITVFDVSVSELKLFRNQFDLLYLGDLDDGESESLARKRPGKPFLPGSVVLRPVNSGLWAFSGEVRDERTGAGLA